MKEPQKRRMNAEEKLRGLYKQQRRFRRELEAERSKRVEFIRALAHELKTPLTPLLSSSDLLVSELPEGPLKNLAQNVNQGATNLNNRIDDLIAIARIEMGIFQLNLEQVDTLQLLHDVVNDVTTEALGPRQSLTSDLPSSLPLIRADEVRLRQILLNLLNNALKLTPEGGTIGIKAREKDTTLIIEIHNTGHSITRKERQRLFEPYRCLGDDGERFSGLGLALCKMLVELHGGQIQVKSHKGKGSTFAFSIPLGSASQQSRN